MCSNPIHYTHTVKSTLCTNVNSDILTVSIQDTYICFG